MDLSYRRVPGTRVAVDVEVLGPGAAGDVLEHLPGWTLVGPPDLVDELAACGGTVRRRFRELRHDLVTLPRGDLPPGYRAVPADRPARDLLPAWHAAYRADGHPDGHPDDAGAMLTGELEPLLAGAHGAVLPWSRLALDPEGAVAAGVIALDVPVVGAWIGDVFRDPGPQHAGLGAALLGHVLHLAVAVGVPSVGLSVTLGNPAERVYRRLGFELVRTLATVVVPG